MFNLPHLAARCMSTMSLRMGFRGAANVRHGESPRCLQQLFQLFDQVGVLRADWLVAAAGIRSLQSTNHRSRNRERGATVISFTHEIPLRSSWNVTAETVPAKSIHDIDGPSFANLRSILRYVEHSRSPPKAAVRRRTSLRKRVPSLS